MAGCEYLLSKENADKTGATKNNCCTHVIFLLFFFAVFG